MIICDMFNVDIRGLEKKTIYPPKGAYYHQIVRV